MTGEDEPLLAEVPRPHPARHPDAATYDDDVTRGPQADTPLRHARGLVVGLVGGAVAVTGHVLAGGSALSPAVLAALLLVCAGSIVASGRRWTLPRLLLALIAAQPVVHGILWLTAPTGSADPRLAAVAPAMRDHPSHGGAGSDVRMVLAHVAAVAVAVVVLVALEGCALSLWALLHAARVVTRAVVVPALGRVATAVRSGAVAADGLVVVRGRPRRGPPRVPAPC